MVSDYYWQVVLLIGDTWWRSGSTVASQPEGCGLILSLSVFKQVYACMCYKL